MVSQNLTETTLNKCLTMPRTEFCKQEIEQCIRTKKIFEYGANFDDDTNAFLEKFHVKDEIIEITQIFFNQNSNLFDPTVFDGILFQYHARPLIFLKNEKFGKENFGYCMCIDFGGLFEIT